jgi:type V secretory pathway adhesin AidA
LRTAAADVPNRETLTASTQPTLDGNNRDAAARPIEPSSRTSIQGAVQDEVGVYRQKLEEAYRALDDAYAQIRALQSPQAQLASARTDDDGFTEHDGDDDRRGRRSDRRRSHDD